jgi:RimJ/RimL family protein N-acetyltransferase
VAFLPSEFEPPPGLEHERFRLRPITIHDVVRDYDAVMSSREHLWGLFGEAWGWPPADLSLEQDLIDLAWHQKEAQLRSSFNFAVMSLDESRLLGCVYVDPAEKEGYDAEVTWWVRADELGGDLDQAVGEAARAWLERAWPFRRVAFPGRDVPWDEYERLPEA